MIDDDKIVLVKGKNGNYSFPKGKYEKKDADIYECARREFIEESGYTDFSYYVDFNSPLFGHSAKGTKSIVYFVCHVIESFPRFVNNYWIPTKKSRSLVFSLWRKSLPWRPWKKIESSWQGMPLQDSREITWIG